MAEKFYAVKVGRKPGIYFTWDVCKKMVDGFPGAIYKSFKSRAEAEAFLGQPGVAHREGALKPENLVNRQEMQNIGMPENYAFVDGSYNGVTGVYGYGGFLVHDGGRELLQGSGSDPEMASMHNVAGEVLGSMAAMEKALELGIAELSIYYDYAGIEMWAEGRWKRNKKGTMAYYDYVSSIRDKLQIHFIKVKGHSGIEGNEEADRLAKESVGIL